jgi:hypothetical protein
MIHFFINFQIIKDGLNIVLLTVQLAQLKI